MINLIFFFLLSLPKAVDKTSFELRHLFLLSIAYTISDILGDMLSDDVWVNFEKVEMAESRVQQVLHYRWYVNDAGPVQVEVALQLVVESFS